MRIRAATPDDIPAILRLANSSLTAAHWTREQYETAFAADALRRAIWVIEDEREEAARRSREMRLRGFLVAREVAGEWEIENIVVERGTRRRHLGTSLLVELQDVARAEHASAIFLEVRESNQPARAFYQSRGFRETGRRPRYYADPVEDAITYRLQLA